MLKNLGMKAKLILLLAVSVSGIALVGVAGIFLVAGIAVSTISVRSGVRRPPAYDDIAEAAGG